MSENTDALGVITKGSLEKGIEMKLHPGVSVETLKAGTFVVIRGENHDFFSMIVDVTLDASNDDILLHPPDASETLLLRVLQQTSIFTTVKLKPMLMLPRRDSQNGEHAIIGEAQILGRNEREQALSKTSDSRLENDSFAGNRVLDIGQNGANGKPNGVSSNGHSANGAPNGVGLNGVSSGISQNGASSKNSRDEHLPVKTVPSHFSRVFKADENDVARIFGKEDLRNSDWFNVGTPLDMSSPVCLDLPRFVERSNGIFGKSGTGKTFLTRTVLCGLIHHRPEVVNLVFDAHNEYGWEARSEGGAPVKGLCQIFGKNRVKIYSLDPQSSRTRGVGHVEEVRISLDQIQPDDLLSMQNELNLADAAAESAHLVRNKFGKKWLEKLLNVGEDDESSAGTEALTLAQQVGGNEQSVAALQRKLQANLKRHNQLLPFLTEKPQGRDILETMLHDIESGVNIVLEFGGQQSTLIYLLVANVLTRRLHAHYVEQYEKWVGRGMRAHDEPKKLMITIEEAHKFLNPQAARQTIFGTIAREMRKYWVTLLVVDQRPSGIDDEILSQIGTRITAQLNDEADISAVLTGVSGASGLKSVLAQLDSKQQALVLGHSVPMPVIIQTRTYGEEMWKTFGFGTSSEDKMKAADVL